MKKRVENWMGHKVAALLLVIVVIGAAAFGLSSFGHSIIANITKSTTTNTNTNNGKNPTYADSLTLYSVQLISSQNASVVLSNYGNGSATLTTYYVLDSSGDQYSRTSWTGPTIPPHTDNGAMSILIGSSCPNCSLTGNAFQFYNLTSYTIKFIDSKSNQWTFPFYCAPNSD